MKEQSDSFDYLLGISQTELERLRFQHGVWSPVTNKFFDRIGVKKGWKCLDVGAGPGFVAMDLSERVGDSGEVTALEPSSFFLEWLKRESQTKGLKNLKFLEGVVGEVALPAGHFDLIFVRWVVAFVADPENFLTQLLPALRPGGVIAVQDYYYEGLSLFPRGGAFDRMPEVVRSYYASVGGDAYIAGKIPQMFRKHNLRLIDFTPTCLTGGADSDQMEWAHRFFVPHIPLMVEKGIVPKQEGDAMLADWLAHRKNPDTIFFSPIVVDVAGKSLS